MYFIIYLTGARTIKSPICSGSALVYGLSIFWGPSGNFLEASTERYSLFSPSALLFLLRDKVLYTSSLLHLNEIPGVVASSDSVKLLL